MPEAESQKDRLIRLYIKIELWKIKILHKIKNSAFLCALF